MAKAAYLDSALRSSGAKRIFSAPSFNEFAVVLPVAAEAANAKLLEKQIVGGLALSKWYPELGEGATLWCATELTTRAQMDAAAAVVAGVQQAELVGAK
jgi:glycine dehydrogenase subunit 1